MVVVIDVGVHIVVIVVIIVNAVVFVAVVVVVVIAVVVLAAARVALGYRLAGHTRIGVKFEVLLRGNC